MSFNQGSVLVTGSNGFLGHFVAKELLRRGHSVLATYRSVAKGTTKRDFERSLSDGLASEEPMPGRLQVQQLDVMDAQSAISVASKCRSMIHVASPFRWLFTDDENEAREALLDPAIQGTKNMMRAATGRCQRVVVTSSIAAMLEGNSSRIVRRNTWADKELQRQRRDWYSLSKTEAEQAAWKAATANNIDLRTLCPGYILGPMQQWKSIPVPLNSSHRTIAKMLGAGEHASIKDVVLPIVDVRDVAQAHALALERDESDSNDALRFPCITQWVSAKEIMEWTAQDFPAMASHLPRVEADESTQSAPNKFDVDCSWFAKNAESVTPRETIRDTVSSLIQNGFVNGGSG